MDNFEAFRRKMLDEGLSAAAVARFEKAYRQLGQANVGQMPENSIDPVQDLTEFDALPLPAGINLGRTVIVKLNGGLGTSMGLTGPKSLLPLKPGKTFLAVAVDQFRQLGGAVPFIFMNSFHTSAPTNQALRELHLQQDLPWEFLQTKVPKVLESDLSPVNWPADPELEWCPPGHGEFYWALSEGGLLAELLRRGYRYAFLSNVDNTGATLDERILDWMAEGGYSMVMEVTRRTPIDRKGGHLARRGESWVLREVAQCPDSDRAAFEDIDRHRFFNTNNLWLDLEQLQELLPGLELPLIVNHKTADPCDPKSPKVLQLESAMGAAIGSLPRTQALCVPRERFAPVKNLSDLLLVRSSAYAIDARAHVVLQTSHGQAPRVSLDASLRTVDDLDRAIPQAPDLIEASSLTVGAGVELPGSTHVWGSCSLGVGLKLPANATVSGVLQFPAGG